jgi:hypothetical protein
MTKRKSGIQVEVGRPIIYYPGLKRYFEKIGIKSGLAKDAAILYSSLDFWQDKGDRKDGFVYKYVKQIEKETGISKTQQWRCRQFLKEIEWLEEKIITDYNNQEVIAFKIKYVLTTSAVNAELTIEESLKC